MAFLLRGMLHQAVCNKKKSAIQRDPLFLSESSNFHFCGTTSISSTSQWTLSREDTPKSLAHKSGRLSISNIPSFRCKHKFPIDQVTGQQSTNWSNSIKELEGTVDRFCPTTYENCCTGKRWLVALLVASRLLRLSPLLLGCNSLPQGAT